MGIRLPTPDYCPLTIANLINTCFLEQPRERPSFHEIKELVLAAYSGIKRTGRTMFPNTSNNLKRIEYTDLKMESRYLTMHKLNQDYQKERNIVLQNETSQLQLDEVSKKYDGSVSFRHVSVQGAVTRCSLGLSFLSRPY